MIKVELFYINLVIYKVQNKLLININIQKNFDCNFQIF